MPAYLDGNVSIFEIKEVGHPPPTEGLFVPLTSYVKRLDIGLCKALCGVVPPTSSFHNRRSPLGVSMENVNTIQPALGPRRKYRLLHKNNIVKGTAWERPTIVDWCRILRVHYHWPLFQAIRYALWLAR